MNGFGLIGRAPGSVDRVGYFTWTKVGETLLRLSLRCAFFKCLYFLCVLNILLCLLCFLYPQLSTNEQIQFKRGLVLGMLMRYYHVNTANA